MSESSAIAYMNENELGSFNKSTEVTRLKMFDHAHSIDDPLPSLYFLPKQDSSMIYFANKMYINR